MIRKIMFQSKGRLIVMFLLLIFSVVQASELTKWTFPSDIETDEERGEYFKNKIEQKARGNFLPDVDFHLGCLAGKNFGYNFPYHGPIEQIAYRIIHSLDYKPRKVVVLGCGNGRNGIDVLKKTNKTEVVFNDTSRQQRNILENAARILDLPQNRMIVDGQDAKQLVNDQEENSVDYYYVANLIHYFRYHEIRKLLKDMFKTSKNGYVFLTFHGYDPNGIYDSNLRQEDNNIFYELKNKTNLDDPCYIESMRISRPSIDQIAKLASEIGFHVGYSKYFYREAVTAILRYSIDNSIKKHIFQHVPCVVSCDYKFEPFDNGTPRDRLPSCQMILTKLD